MKTAAHVRAKALLVALTLVLTLIPFVQTASAANEPWREDEHYEGNWTWVYTAAEFCNALEKGTADRIILANDIYVPKSFFHTGSAGYDKGSLQTKVPGSAEMRAVSINKKRDSGHLIVDGNSNSLIFEGRHYVGGIGAGDLWIGSGTTNLTEITFRNLNIYGRTENGFIHSNFWYGAINFYNVKYVGPGMSDMEGENAKSLARLINCDITLATRIDDTVYSSPQEYEDWAYVGVGNRADVTEVAIKGDGLTLSIADSHPSECLAARRIEIHGDVQIEKVDYKVLTKGVYAPAYHADNVFLLWYSNLAGKTNPPSFEVFEDSNLTVYDHTSLDSISGGLCNGNPSGLFSIWSLAGVDYAADVIVGERAGLYYYADGAAAITSGLTIETDKANLNKFEVREDATVVFDIKPNVTKALRNDNHAYMTAKDIVIYPGAKWVYTMDASDPNNKLVEADTLLETNTLSVYGNEYKRATVAISVTGQTAAKKMKNLVTLAGTKPNAVPKVMITGPEALLLFNSNAAGNALYNSTAKKAEIALYNTTLSAWRGASDAVLSGYAVASPTPFGTWYLENHAASFVKKGTVTNTPASVTLFGNNLENVNIIGGEAFYLMQG
jgi:hypothetical protein